MYQCKKYTPKLGAGSCGHSDITTSKLGGGPVQLPPGAMETWSKAQRQEKEPANQNRHRPSNIEHQEGNNNIDNIRARTKPRTTSAEPGKLFSPNHQEGEHQGAHQLHIENLNGGVGTHYGGGSTHQTSLYIENSVGCCNGGLLRGS